MYPHIVTSSPHFPSLQTCVAVTCDANEAKQFLCVDVGDLRDSSYRNCTAPVLCSNAAASDASFRKSRGSVKVARHISYGTRKRPVASHPSNDETRFSPSEARASSPAHETISERRCDLDCSMILFFSLCNIRSIQISLIVIAHHVVGRLVPLVDPSLHRTYLTD